MADGRRARRCYPGEIGTRGEEGRETRILVVFEGDYRAYRDVLAAGIRILRPHVEVETSELEALEEEVARIKPQVLICSLPEPVDSRDRRIGGAGGGGCAHKAAGAHLQPARARGLGRLGRLG